MAGGSGIVSRYDAGGRLTEAATPGGTFNFTLDGNANRLRSSINGGPETSYAVNAADQLCHTASVQAACGSAPLGAGTYQYDPNGNLTGQSDGRVLTHNSKDQTTSFTPGGLLAQTTNMSYLGAGQSERKTAGGATFKNGPLGLAINSSGLLSSTNYVRTPEGELVSLRNGSVAHYYLFDRLGSVVALTDSAGNAVNRYFYDPYGNYLVGTTEAVANPWQYAGGFKDAFSGYYKFGARYYDPVIGRWTQPDPSGMDANSYAYAGSCPNNFADPTGLSSSNDPFPSRIRLCRGGTVGAALVNGVGGVIQTFVGTGLLFFSGIRARRPCHSWSRCLCNRSRNLSFEQGCESAIQN